ncbi:hypothetical protein EVAR_98625_1 [Eumeta japonica]|uniref:RNA-directed DNA polymerase from mobile element jockey n=1 Tax=Eumeta variegata TaxID=151549 RepID=A0A4C1XUL0_EUMVA|nr:hypothetical protein EVAR_98625_1 [Eumeta japonica]
MAGAYPGPGEARSSKKLSLEEMKEMFFHFLAEQGYVIPKEANQLLNPVSVNSRSRESPPCPSASSGKRSSSALSSNDSSEQSDAPSDDTVKGSDDETSTSFVVYTKKKRNPKRRSVCRHAEHTNKATNSIQMETEPIPVASAIARESSGSPKTVASVTSTSSEQVTTKVSNINSNQPDNLKIKNNTLTTPPRARPPPPVYLRDKTGWNAVSSECTIARSICQSPKYRPRPRCAPNAQKGRNTFRMVLAISDKNEIAKEVFRNLSKICGLSGITVEAPYRRVIRPTTADVRPVPRLNKSKSRTVAPTTRKVTVTPPETKTIAGGDGFRPAPIPSIKTLGLGQRKNNWLRRLLSGRCPKLSTPLRQAASALGEDITTIMSILQVVRSVEVSDLAAKFRKAKHGVDHLKIILDNQDLINRLSMTGHGILILVSVYLPSKKELLRGDLEALFALEDAVILFGDFNSKSTNWKCNYTNRNDIALMRGVALKLSCIEPLQCLNSDHRPGLMSIPNDIVSTHDIDNAIGALTNHIRTVIESSSRTVPAKSDRRELPGDIIELIRDKNAALHRARKYLICENRSHTRALQLKVKARIKEVWHENWSNLIVEISPSHQAYWRLAKALKTDGAIPIPALRKPDRSIAFDDREKTVLADSFEQQCTENPPYDSEHVHKVEEEVRHRVSHPKTIWILSHKTKLVSTLKGLKSEKPHARIPLAVKHEVFFCASSSSLGHDFQCVH